jgi:hypothetical protein
MSNENHTMLDPKEAGVKSGEICILMASRGRPEMLAEELSTLHANTVRKDNTVVWIYVDDDDQITLEALRGKKFPAPGLDVRWQIGPRPSACGQAHQALWKASCGTAEIYMISCDDARFDTPGWDDIVRREFAPYADGVLLAFAHDPNTGNQATYPFIGWGFLKTLGYQRVFPGIFAFWFDDKWVEEIAQMAGRYIKIPIVINPIGGDKGKTQRMRCVPFWTRFFQLLLVERKECARELIGAMFPRVEADRRRALEEMENEFSQLKKDGEDAFSDLYGVFQEERHSALAPEDRNRFNPLYLKQEVIAVVRLLSIAQDYITKGDYQEALNYVEATQMADIRMRAAQDMKIQCLRALGRGDEAEKLAREALLAWPETKALRRLFRFLGMVANEGRRLLAKGPTKAK